MEPDTSPKLLSIEFHTRFFPSLLRSRLRPRERGGSGFTSTFDHLIIFAVCIVMLALGIPSAVSRNSIIGWIVGGVGAAGTVALVINSIISHKESPSYDSFLTGVFFLFIAVGITAGIFAGTIEHSIALGILVGAAGLIAGYPLGILAGLWFQYLGWLASIVNGLSILAILGMFIVDLVLLSGYLF